jgi:hypothetical protein
MDTLPRSEVGKVLRRELVLTGVAGESEAGIDTANQSG